MITYHTFSLFYDRCVADTCVHRFEEIDIEELKLAARFGSHKDNAAAFGRPMHRFDDPAI